MANSSFSSSIQSYSEPLTQDQELAIYKSVKMNLQDIQKATNDINLKFRDARREMRVTAALLNAIESKEPAVNQD